MLVALQTFNNITMHRLLKTYYEVSLDSHFYQTTNNFEKLLKRRDMKNTVMIAIPILLVIYMYKEPVRLL